MEDRSVLRRCPTCDAHIPAEAPQGLCPKCLLAEVSIPTGAGTAIPKSPAPSLDAVAAAFPQLEILGLIGQGGMGFVFKARQPKLDRFVALKILPESLASDPAFSDRFSREGRVLARLSHANIVTIHDFGQANGFFYLLMEYVDGVNLRQAMKAGRFTAEQALAVVPRICDALQFAHNEGILHRDIKPENILLDSKGRIKIADFGIAKILGTQSGGLSDPFAESDAGANTTGVIGTPQYMAPEQIENPRAVDQRADIYSLGVVFYEMLTGELPLGRFAPPSEKSRVDPRLDEVVLRALEKEPDRRTGSADEVKTQIETIAQKVSPLPPPPLLVPPTASTSRPARTAFVRGMQTGVIVFLLILLGVAIISFLLPKTYVGVARVLIRQQNGYDPYRIQVELERMQSVDLLQKVAASQDLARQWGRKYRTATLDDETLVRLLRGAVVVRTSRNTSVAEIRFHSDSPTEAANIANGIAETYSAASGPRVSIIEAATVSTRAIRPNRPLNIVVGALVGAAIGLLTGLTVGLVTFWRLRDSRDVAATSTSAIRMPVWVKAAAVLILVLVAVLGILIASDNSNPSGPNPSFLAEKRGRALEPSPTPGKIIEISKVTAGRDGRVSAWTQSSLPPGEGVTAITKSIDGRVEVSLTQRITIRSQNGKQTSTVFSWEIPQSFDREATQRAHSQAENNALGKALRLEPDNPFVLFVLTNSTGGTMEGSIEYRPAAPNHSGLIEGSVRFSGATTTSKMVLAYFNSSVPDGHVLEGGALVAGRDEAEVHTSVARSFGYNNGSCRWDFPDGFTTEEMETAVAQISKKIQAAPLIIRAGERVSLFSVTSKAGATYEGFLELLAPAPVSEILAE